MKTNTTTSRTFRGLSATALALTALAGAFISTPSARAAITQSDSTGDASGFSVNASDLVNQGQTTLTSATRSHVPLHSTAGDFGGYDPANTGLNVPYANDGAIGAFTTSPWGKNVEYYPMTNPTSAYPLPVTYTFTLNTTLNPAGYDISGVTSTCGYLWNNDWCANQVFKVEVTKDGSSWLDLGTYTYKPYTTTSQNSMLTQVSLASGGAALDNGTYAAKNVTGIRITYSDTGNRGGFDGTAIKEIDVVGAPSAALVVDAAASTVTASPTSVASDGVTYSTITVTLKDAASTPVPGKTVTLASDRGAADTISAASGLSNGSGVVTFTVTSTTTGPAVFTATDVTDSNLLITDTATVTFMSDAVSAANSTVSASPTSVVADGSTTATITVTLKNADNNPLAGKDVTLAKTSGPGSPVIAPASATTDGSGVATFTVSSTTIGADVFAATETADNVTVAQTATVTFTAGAVDAGTSTVVAAPAIVPADGTTTTTVTVTLKDASNNPVADKTVTLVSNRTSTDTISAASGPSDASGVVTFTVTSLTAGSSVFTATGDGVELSATPGVTFGPSPSASTVAASLSPLSADGTATSTITVTVMDGAANPVAGKTVTLVSNRGAADAISAASGPSDASGIVTFTVSSTTAGSPVFTATDTTDGITIGTTSVTFEAGPVVAGTSTVSASPTTVAADGVATSTITVTLKDAYNNPVAGKDVSLVSSRLTDDAISAASGPSNASGVVTFTVSSSTSGSPVFTATETTDDPAVVITQTATVTFVHVTAVTWAETLLDVSTTATGIEIANDGTLVRAHHFGNAGVITDVTVHEVPFTKGGSAENGLTDTAMGGTWVGGWSGWNGNWSLASITDPACNQLISSMIMASSSSTITIGSLTVGHTYRLQLISNNPRHGQIGVEGATHTLSGGDNAKPVLLAATWVAGDDTLNMSMLNNDMHFNAYALHDLAGAPPVSDYTTWTSQYPGFDLSNPAADADGDGLSNQQEYAFGLDPTKGSSVNPCSPLLGTQFSYTRRATSGLNYTVEYSTDLATWNPATATQVPGEPDSNGVQIVTVTVSNAPVDGKLFVRVQAQ